jgi:hypothetical protein
MTYFAVTGMPVFDDPELGGMAQRFNAPVLKTENCPWQKFQSLDFCTSNLMLRAGTRRCCWLRGESEVEGAARALVGSRLEASAMGFDYGAADRKAHSYTIRSGGVESVEEAFGIACAETATKVLRLD